ncbi:MAG: hypothetical protein AAB353_06325, partial [Candidatus Hydrogenedentota bacterium]
MRLACLMCGAALLPHVCFAANFFVDPATGNCINPANEDTFCTIQEAIDAAFADGGGNVLITPGVYREQVIVRAGVDLRRPDGAVDPIAIEYDAETALSSVLVTVEQDARIRDIGLCAPDGTAPGVTLLLVPNVEAEIENVTFDGGMNTDSIGVLVRGTGSSSTRIRQSTFINLSVGIQSENSGFRIVENIFDAIGRDAIFVAQPVTGTTTETPRVGDRGFIESSGFIRFRSIGEVSGSADAAFVR